MVDDEAVEAALSAWNRVSSRSDRDHMRAALEAAAPLIVKAEREACAMIIVNGQETIISDKDGDARIITKRSPGNRMGIAYAAAIRARADEGKEKLI